MELTRPRQAVRRPRLVLRTSAVGLLAAIGTVQNVSGATSYVPSQIRTAYNVNSVSATGAGTTIAIIDAYKDATIASDVASFNSLYGLQAFNVTGGPTFTIVGQTLSTTSLPGAPSSADKADSDAETALDVEWAHTIAPGANILLVEANSLGDSDLVTAINNVKNDTKYGATVVSMSFGGAEFSGEQSTTFNSGILNDNTFQQSTSRTNKVTFLASSGDDGTVSSPASSPYVMAIGGTSLTLNANNTRKTEKVWNNNTDGSGGNGSTGAGVSAYEAKPSYQTIAAAGFSKRVIPDVTWDGDPYTGYNIYTEGAISQYNGGTSISCPQWAGLIALADQIRVAAGRAALSTNDALTMLYALYGTPFYSQAFYDITSGAANGYSATTGFDAASGLGSPIASFIVPYLGGSISLPEPMAACGMLLVVGGFGRRRARKA